MSRWSIFSFTQKLWVDQNVVFITDRLLTDDNKFKYPFLPRTNAATFLSRETIIIDQQTAQWRVHTARDTQRTLIAYVQWRAEQISKLSLTTTRHPDVQRQTYRQTDGETVVIIVNSTTLNVYTDVHTSDKTLVSRLRYYTAWTRPTVRYAFVQRNLKVRAARQRR